MVIQLSNSTNEKTLGTIREQIQNLWDDLAKLPMPPVDQLELIRSANLLRTNEYFIKKDRIQSELLSKYTEYAEMFEKVLPAVLDVQKELLDVIRTQSALALSKDSHGTRSTKRKKTQKNK